MMRYWHQLIRAGRKFSSDGCPTLAAAIAFYSLFSLPSLLALVVWLAGFALDPEDVPGRVESEIRAVTGNVGAKQIRALLQNARESPPNWAGRIVGLASLLFGASGVVGQVQNSLNKIWSVQVDPRKNFFKSLFVKRMISILLVVAVGLLLIVSLLINTMLSAWGRELEEFNPAGSGDRILVVFHALATVLFVWLVFAGLFRFLPDVKITWQRVAGGSLVSALCFTLGNNLLGWFLSQQKIGSAYGSAGSLAVLLVWVYYSVMIFLFGAELTHESDAQANEKIEAEEGATLVEPERGN